MAGIGKYKGEGEFNMKPSEFYGYGNQKVGTPLNFGGMKEQQAEHNCDGIDRPNPSKEERANMLACPDFKSNSKAQKGRGLGL